MRSAGRSLSDGVVPQQIQPCHISLAKTKPRAATSLAGAREKAQEFAGLGGTFASISGLVIQVRRSVARGKNNADEKTA
jgi:hypothetical protein